MPTVNGSGEWKKAWMRYMAEEKKEHPTPTPGSDRMSPEKEAEIRAQTPTPMDVEGMKRAKEPTGAWRKRQGRGKPEWYEGEY